MYLFPNRLCLGNDKIGKTVVKKKNLLLKITHKLLLETCFSKLFIKISLIENVNK